jgi:hypothetical protein
MNESQEAAIAEAAPKQATNMSLSQFTRSRAGQLTAQASETTETVEEGQVLGSETNQVEQETAEASEAAAEDNSINEDSEEETSVEESEQSESTEEETSEDVLSQIELDDLSEDDLRELSEKLGSRAVARFGELTAKRKAAEAELEKLKAQAKSQITPEVKDSDNPYKHLENIDELQSVAKQVEDVIEWAEDLIFNSDGYSADEVITEVEGKEMTKSDVRKHLQNARKAEKKFIPAQAQKIQRIQDAKESGENLIAKAKKEFKWMQDDNEVNSKYNDMLNDERLKGLDKFDPEVSAQLPYLLAHAANSMFGRKLVQDEPRKGRLIPPSSTPASAKSEKKMPSAVKNLNNASNQFLQSGNKNDYIRLRTLQLSQ